MSDSPPVYAVKDKITPVLLVIRLEFQRSCNERHTSTTNKRELVYRRCTASIVGLRRIAAGRGTGREDRAGRDRTVWAERENLSNTTLLAASERAAWRGYGTSKKAATVTGKRGLIYC